MEFPNFDGKSELVSQLQDWFNTWWRRPPGAEEQKLFYELILQGDSELVNQLSPTELQELVRTWEKRLILSLSQEVPRERVLCGFSCVEDTIYRLDQKELDAFVVWAAKKMSLKPQAFVDEAAKRARAEKNSQGGSLQDESHDLTDVLAALLHAWQPGRSGMKPGLMTPTLRNRLDDFVALRRKKKKDAVLRLLGGASGNMANVLRKLGLPVAIHWAYHARDLAPLCPDGLHRMTLEDEKEYLPARIGAPGHPKRRSIIFSYAPGLVLKPKPTSSLGWQPAKIDRQIYAYPSYIHAGGRSWTNNIYLKEEPNRCVPIHDPGDKVLRRVGWPFIPLFGTWDIDDKKNLVFSVSDDTLMKAVAEEFDYVMLSGLHVFRDPLLNVKGPRGGDMNKKARRFIQTHMKRQLRILAQHGVRLHYEVSGMSDPAVALQVQEAIKGFVKSAGINQEELEAYTGTKAFKGTPFYLKARKQAESFDLRFQRARRLAQALDLDQLYVHGNDADLILMRGASRGAIRQALMADLFTKGIVVLALLERSLGEPGWREEAARLSIVLKKDGFWALLELARHIARTHGKTPRAQDLILRDMAFNGYWFNRNPDDYSAVVVPVMWPALPSDLSTAGAGDAVSAAFAVLGRI